MKNRNFEVILTSDFNFCELFAKNFLRAIKPEGVCREGTFSSLDTDLPYLPYEGEKNPLSEEEIEEGVSSWSYDQFDFNNILSFVSYESCTGSKVIIHNIMNDYNLRAESVGPNTFRNIFWAVVTTLENIKIPDWYESQNWKKDPELFRIYKKFLEIKAQFEKNQAIISAGFFASSTSEEVKATLNRVLLNPIEKWDLEAFFLLVKGEDLGKCGFSKVRRTRDGIRGVLVTPRRNYSWALRIYNDPKFSASEEELAEIIATFNSLKVA